MGLRVSTHLHCVVLQCVKCGKNVVDLNDGYDFSDVWTTKASDAPGDLEKKSYSERETLSCF